MGFKNEKEYLEFRQKIFDYLWDRMEPIADKIDCDDYFPIQDYFEEFRELGMWGLQIPEEYGGVGLPASQYLPILGEISKISNAVRMVHVHVGMSRLMNLAARKDQKKEYLPKMAVGESSMCFCVTEPNAGTGVDIKTTARKDGDNYILNGNKHLITNSHFAQYFIVLAYTNRELGRKGLTLFLVDRDSPGFHLVDHRPLLGARGTTHGILALEDCVVPANMVIGYEGDGLENILHELEYSRMCISSCALGVAERALQLALEYSKKRVTFGKPICKRQAVQTYLADMAADVYAMRSMIANTVEKLDRGIPTPAESSCCKVFCSHAACRVTDTALLVFGGIGYTHAYPIERLLRDARLNLLEEGTPTIQRHVIAETLLQEYPKDFEFKNIPFIPDPNGH